MLATLAIRNFALIESLELAFEGGFTAITGETGAGKTILLGALGMILGERASTDAVRTGAEKAVVEGTFTGLAAARAAALLERHEIEVQDMLLMRREISLRGQNRCFVNDTPVTLAVLKEIGDTLVDLHGQHEHQSLLAPETHIRFLDGFAGTETEREEYGLSYDSLAALIAEVRTLRENERTGRDKRDALVFQRKELDAVSPQPDEDGALQIELKRAENVEQLFAVTAELQSLLYEGERSVHDQLSQARARIASLAGIDPSFEAMRAECDSAAAALDDLAASLRRYNERLEFDPASLEEKRMRLSAIAGLKKKYGGTLESVLARREEIARQLAAAENFDAEIARLEERIAREREACAARAQALSAARTRAADKLERAIVASLETLGIASPAFRVWLATREARAGDEPFVAIGGRLYVAAPEGIDRAEFLISTNAGEPVKPLAKIASGGEISRVMLALKSALAAGDETPVLVFDEIDSGISGRVAQKAGAAMRELAKRHQIIAVTHLPQIAGFAQHHFAVEKSQSGGKTATTVKKLAEHERVYEIAKLLSGENVTEASLKSAKELMKSEA